MTKDQKFTGTWVALKAGIGWWGLVGYWDMESLTNDGKLKDFSWYGNVGSFSWMNYEDSVTWSINGKWLNFSWWMIIVNHSDSLNFGLNTTISVMFKPNNLDSDVSYIINKYWPYWTSEWKGFHLLTTNQDNGLGIKKWFVIGGRYGTPLPWKYINTDTYETSVLEYYNLVWKIENGTMSLYINGKKVISNSFNPWNGIGNELQNLWIWGKSDSVIRRFNWLIDEVRIYNRALSDSEISALYNATK